MAEGKTELEDAEEANGRLSEVQIVELSRRTPLWRRELMLRGFYMRDLGKRGCFCLSISLLVIYLILLVVIILAYLSAKARQSMTLAEYLLTIAGAMTGVFASESGQYLVKSGCSPQMDLIVNIGSALICVMLMILKIGFTWEPEEAFVIAFNVLLAIILSYYMRLTRRLMEAGRTTQYRERNH